jgi:hypothetical protein
MCIYSERVSVALFTRHSKCMRCIIMLPVACQAVQYFSTLYHTRYNTRKIIFAYKTRVLIFSTTSFWNIYHSKTNWARCCHKCAYVFRVNSPLFLSDFNPNLIFSSDLQKIIKYRISGKSVQWKQDYSMRTDGRTDGQIDRQTDMMKLVVTFRKFTNTLKNV